MNAYLGKLLLGLLLFILFSAGQAVAHCEIPCGIYDDELRISLIREHINTIEKSMNQIVTLQKDADKNANQLIRWVTNKEAHANELQEIVTQYFMTQRLKPTAKQYQEKLGSLHKMLLAAMKSKQTTDLEHISQLRDLVDQFEKMYFAH